MAGASRLVGHRGNGSGGNGKGRKTNTTLNTWRKITVLDFATMTLHPCSKLNSLTQTSGRIFSRPLEQGEDL